MGDPFALPPVTPKTTKSLRAAASYVSERMRTHSDARDIIKGLVQHNGATLTHPGYRTALRCGGIYTEAAAYCDLAVAKLLISSFVKKAELYLWEAGGSDLFANLVEGMEAR